MPEEPDGEAESRHLSHTDGGVGSGPSDSYDPEQATPAQPVGGSQGKRNGEIAPLAGEPGLIWELFEGAGDIFVEGVRGLLRMRPSRPEMDFEDLGPMSKFYHSAFVIALVLIGIGVLIQALIDVRNAGVTYWKTQPLVVAVALLAGSLVAPQATVWAWRSSRENTGRESVLAPVVASITEPVTILFAWGVAGICVLLQMFLRFDIGTISLEAIRTLPAVGGALILLLFVCGTSVAALGIILSVLGLSTEELDSWPTRWILFPAFLFGSLPIWTWFAGGDNVLNPFPPQPGTLPVDPRSLLLLASFAGFSVYCVSYIAVAQSLENEETTDTP